MAEHNWPDLTRRFVAREWPSVPAMAKATGVPIDTLKKKSKALQWLRLRTAHDAKVNAKAMKISVNSQAQQVSKIKAGWISLAQKFRAKLMTALSKKLEMTPTEMVRMAMVIQQLEARAYGIGQGVRGSTLDTDEPLDGSMIVNNTQINLNAPSETPPALAADFSEEQLVKLLGPKIVDAGMAGSSKAADTPAGRGRAAKAKPSKK